MTTLATILFSIAFFLFDIAAIIALVFIICKIVAKIKARKAAKKDTKKNDDTTTDTPVDTKDGDNKSDDTNTDENGEGTSTASEKEEATWQSARTIAKNADKKADEANVKAEAADKKAGEAIDVAKDAEKTANEAKGAAEAANEKANEALEANQATDKKVEEEKAAKAEEQRQASIAKNADEIDLYVLRFSKAYSDYATAVLRRNTKVYAGKELAEKADEASKKFCASESAQICRDTDYGYAGELKRTGYQNIGARQRRGEEVVPEEQSGLDENELKAFCDADNANADFEAAKAEAEAANKAVVSNNDEVSNFKGVADSAVTAMKAAYAGLKACKLNDDEIATKVNLEVAMLKAIVA